MRERHIPLLSIALGRLHDDVKELCNKPLVGSSLPALHLASKLGFLDVVNLLLNICDVNKRDEDKRTALYYAAERGHLQIARSLLTSSKGAAKVDATSSNNKVPTPLWFAASNRHEQIVSLLIENGASVKYDSKKNLDQTPLFQAVKHGHLGVVDRLPPVGVGGDNNNNVPQRVQDFFLAQAVEMGQEAIADLLRDKGASLKDTRGERERREPSRQLTRLPSPYPEPKAHPLTVYSTNAK